MVRVGKSSVGKGRSGTKILRQEWAWVWKKNMKLEGRCRQVRWCVSSQAMPKKTWIFILGGLGSHGEFLARDWKDADLGVKMSSWVAVGNGEGKAIWSRETGQEAVGDAPVRDGGGLERSPSRVEGKWTDCRRGSPHDSALGLDLEGRRKGRFKDKFWSFWFELAGSIY